MGMLEICVRRMVEDEESNELGTKPGPLATTKGSKSQCPDLASARHR